MLLRALLFLYRALYWHHANAFERALNRPEATQNKTLKRILTASAKTEYGRAYNIDGQMNYEQYSKRVPIVTYNEIESWVERQKLSIDSVITPAHVKIYEKTSGSLGRAKYIPYNQAHLKTFTRMFVLWSLDLLNRGLKLKHGRVFFLVSPQLTSDLTVENGTHIGMKNDSHYLSGFVSRIANQFFVDTSKLVDSDTYICDLANLLLAETELEVISIWSPSLLLVLLDYIRIELKIDKPTEVLWPHLKLISCWCSATAHTEAEKLAKHFCHVRIQGKGLLATEAAMTVPWADSEVALISDIFYEFQDEETDEILRIQDIIDGRVYRIIITAPNGFLRYSIGDRVRAGKLHNQTPTFTFVGRSHQVCDLVGEKLDSVFVERVVRECNSDHFALLVPFQDGDGRGYVLMTDGFAFSPETLAQKIESKLRSQYHYDHARRLQQLLPVSTLSVNNLRGKYYDLRKTQGRVYGQAKVSALVTDLELARLLLTKLNGETHDEGLTRHEPSREFRPTSPKTLTLP